jgi:ubiquinone/menaquinone biosynthesis C-methylase UbiE
LKSTHNKEVKPEKIEVYDNTKEQKFWNNDSEWERDGEEWSDVFGGTEKVWNEIIYPKIKDYLKGNILEIAPGHGRITKYLLKYTNNLSVVDLNENCIIKCRERFGNYIQKYSINNGKSLSDFKDESLDFVFSWDSFVHMDKFVIQNYLSEIYRVLKPNGIGYIHHSFFFNGNIESKKNVAGRSNMNPELFNRMLEISKLKLISQEEVKGVVVDTISTFKK